MKMKGRAALVKRIRTIPPKVIRAAKVALEKSADDVVAAQKRLVPVDDGALMGSIRRGMATSEGPNLSVTIEAGGPATTRQVREGQSATYDYAAAKEFGTREHPAEPFFYPAYRLRKKANRARIKRAIRKALKES